MENSQSTHTASKPNPWAWIPTLYFAEGLPNAIVTLVAVLMYKRLGMSNAEIAFYTSWLYLPWVIKAVWSPFVDILKTKRWWTVSMQLLIGAALGGVAFTIPGNYWIQGSMFCFWIMAFSSATHDIAADGFYMLGLNSHQQSFFSGIRNTFYRLSMMFGQGVLVMIAGNLETMTRNIRYSWSLTFYLAAGIMIFLGLFHGFILPRPKGDHAAGGNENKNDTLRYDNDNPQPITHNLLKDFAESFISFFRKDGIWVALLFIFFYRAPEGMLTKIVPLFLNDPLHKGGLGLSPQDIGLVSGTVGLIGLTIGGIIGGIVASKYGLKKVLWPMVCAITLPDLVYVYLSTTQPESLLPINICVFIEQFGYGVGFTAYMLYLIYFCQGEHQTSHYAICTGFMAASLMLPGMIAGWLQETLGYTWFFIIVTLLCAITFIVSALVKINPDFGKK